MYLRPFEPWSISPNVRRLWCAAWHCSGIDETSRENFNACNGSPGALGHGGAAQIFAPYHIFLYKLFNFNLISIRFNTYILVAPEMKHSRFISFHFFSIFK